jgi:hypothetical protein
MGFHYLDAFETFNMSLFRRSTQNPQISPIYHLLTPNLSRYFTIDELRMEEMQKSGALCNVVLDPGDRKHGQIWIVTNKAKSNSELEGDLTFQAGE